MICKICEYKNQEIAHFCSNCGTNLRITSLRSIKTEISLDKKNLDQIKQLMDTIESLDGVESEFEQQKAYEISLQEELQQVSYKIDQLETKLQQESQDVEKLENFTFTSLFARIKGDYDEKLDKELEERVLVEEQLSVAEETSKDLESQLNRVREERQELEQLVTKYNNLKSQLESLLVSTFEGISHPEEDRLENQLHDLSQRKNDLKLELDRYHNATNHLHSAYRNLEQGYDKLSSAGNYAAWDTFFDGGIIADSIKHSRWDDARRYIRTANLKINSARQILPDIPSIFVSAEKTGSDFFDVWMDNIFSDFRARDQIKQSRDQVNYAMRQVSRIIRDLQSKINHYKNDMYQLNQQYSSIHNKLRDKRLELVSKQLKEK